MEESRYMHPLPYPALKISVSNPSFKISGVFQNGLGISKITSDVHTDGVSNIAQTSTIFN